MTRFKGWAQCERMKKYAKHGFKVVFRVNNFFRHRGLCNCCLRTIDTMTMVNGIYCLSQRNTLTLGNHLDTIQIAVAQYRNTMHHAERSSNGDLRFMRLLLVVYPDILLYLNAGTKLEPRKTYN